MKEFGLTRSYKDDDNNIPTTVKLEKDVNETDINANEERELS